MVFLPQILILFFFIGLLQDTGYMARAAFIMDRVMNKVGLHGKSFIPLLSSFACAIPGIMSARTIESPKDRLVTILVAPLMSCSARLPVYTVMIAVIMPLANSFQKAGLMLAMYLIGIIGACLMAWFFKTTLLRSQKPVFIMELPPYRLPSWKSIMLHMWERTGLFVKRAGTVILALSIILWALMTYPKHPHLEKSEALKSSFAGSAGTALETVIKPLGFDWRIGIGLIGSFAAREVFVSTMSIVFNLGDEAKEDTLREAFQKAKWPDGRPLFTPLVCVTLMIFYVFALQCVSTIAVVYRETNSWTWPLFQFVYMALLAYLASLIVYQGGRWLGF
jgi:ferrous iron transport protein B